MKKVSQIGEFGLIERIQKRIRTGSQTIVGIGDDTAVLKESNGNILLATDLLVENVDFSFRSATPEEIGWKALAVNLSDIAAMGGKPEAALVGLVLPKFVALKAIDQFYDGLLKLAKKLHVSIVGGDLSSGPCWMVAVTIFGNIQSGRQILRKGAKPGDFICVTGSLGGSVEGKHLRFMPRIPEGQFLAKIGIHSMIDVSDGLLQDLGHLLRASKAGAKLELDQIPISKEAYKMSKKNPKKALSRALTDGEDFELLFTISKHKWKKLQTSWKKKFKTPVRSIGFVTNQENKILFLQNGRPVHFHFNKKGFQHF